MREEINMLKVITHICFALVMLVFLVSCVEAPSENVQLIELHYFYDGLCSSCNHLSLFHDLLSEVLADVRQEHPYTVVAHNAFSTAGRSVGKDFFSYLGLGEDFLHTAPLPILVINGEVFYGNEAIRSNLRSAYLIAVEKNSP